MLGLRMDEAAGLILFLEHAGEGKFNEYLESTRNQTGIFQYFAGEIFRQTDLRTRQFLIKTSLVPEITEKVATELTNTKNPERILGELVRKNFFTVKLETSPSAYRYHPLCREFLLSRLKEELDPSSHSRLQQKAARLVAQEGKIDDAFTLQNT